MANEYVTSVALKATLTLTGQTFADADVAAALEAASRGIDDVCGQRFYADSDATQVRYYTPVTKTLLRIDPLTTLTSLKTDPSGDGTFEETWTQNTDFVLEPLNPELIDGASREPWTMVRAHPSGSYYFPASYPRSVQVTGKFGWAATPPAVKQATTILAAKLLLRSREAPFGIVSLGIDQGAARIARSDPDVAMLLRPYVRVRLQ